MTLTDAQRVRRLHKAAAKACSEIDRLRNHYYCAGGILVELVNLRNNLLAAIENTATDPKAK